MGKWSVSGATAQHTVHADDLAPRALAAGEAPIAPMAVADLERHVREAR
jgi:hypothetical protein